MPAATPRLALRHDALFYDSDQQLVTAAIGFVRDGIERGETVLVNTMPLPGTRLMKAVFHDEPLVHFARSAVYSKPTAVLDRYQRLLERALDEGSPGVRAIGHIDLAGGPLPWQEWVRYEAAVNRFLATYPFRTICPYDTRTVDSAALRGMRRAHPTFLQGAERLETEEYLDPTELANDPEYVVGPDPVELTPPALELGEVTTLRAFRLDIYPALLGAPFPKLTLDDFVKAVGEVAMNARKHGEGRVRVRVWVTPEKLVATVNDRGEGITDALAGYGRPARPRPGESPNQASSGGLGLWAARQLCDLLDYRHGDDGFTVRVVTLRP